MPGSDIETLAVVANHGFAGRVRAEAATISLRAAPFYADSSPIFASDSRFVLPTEQWKHAAFEWAKRPDRSLGVVHLGLLADARMLQEPDGMSRDSSATFLPDLAFAACSRHPTVIDEILHDSLAVSSTYPNRIRAMVRTDIQYSIKNRVLVPVVKLARWTAVRQAALGYPHRAGETSERLRNARDSALPELRDLHWSAITEAYEAARSILWDVRARVDDADGPSTAPTGQEVSLSTLTIPQRSTLKDAVREIAGAQRQLRFLHESGSLRIAKQP